MRTEEEIRQQLSKLVDIKQSRMTGDPDSIASNYDQRLDASIRTLVWILNELKTTEYIPPYMMFMGYK